MNQPTIVRRPKFTIAFNPDNSIIAIETNQKKLYLVCQTAVQQSTCCDNGMVWTFKSQTEINGIVEWRFSAECSIWQSKELLIEITPDEILWSVQIIGKGVIDKVIYFAGIPDTSRVEEHSTMKQLSWAGQNWGRVWYGSPITFNQMFNPQPNNLNKQTLASTINQRITCATTFGPDIFNTFFAPPLFAYVMDESFCFGIVSSIQESRYTHFDYTPANGWGFELHHDGMTQVDGVWQSPKIRIAPCVDIDAGLKEYVMYLRQNGFAPIEGLTPPQWAHRPMFCGWGQQTAWAKLDSTGNKLPVGSPITPGAGGYASQKAYGEMVSILDKRQLPWGTLTIDMGWSTILTLPTVNKDLWPDLKGFIATLHRQGKKVFLWLAAWNPTGLPEEFIIKRLHSIPAVCDPSISGFRKKMIDSIDYCISPQGLDADGFKLDFTGDLPRGTGYRPAGNLWGLAYMHDYIKLIYDAMKAAKADSVLETQCPNPHFSGFTSMVRLNDIFSPQEDIRAMMAFRSRMAHLVNPKCVIDTDNDPFVSVSAWMDYMRFQPAIGIPSLYTLTHMSFNQDNRQNEAIPEACWTEIKQIWHEYLKTKKLNGPQ